jgi:TPR repeat protein
LFCYCCRGHPFDETRPDGVPGVSLEKIVPESAISACELAAEAAPNDARIAMQLGRAYQAARNFDAARVQYLKAYENGSAQAAANLALHYLNGQGGLAKDDSESLLMDALPMGFVKGRSVGVV